MTTQKKQRRIFGGMVAAVALIVLCVGGFLLYDRGRPAPVPMERRLFDGITYDRQVQYYPRFRVVHVIKVDLRNNNLEFLVTPPDDDSDKPLKARTTTQFVKEFGAQIAINGGGFTPWWSYTVLDYYPHEGDPVRPNGLAASQGAVYVPEGKGATLYISRNNSLSFDTTPGRIYNAVTGDRMLVQKGSPAADLDDGDRDPRTAIGANQNGRWLIIVVVDGRQPYYSDGATLKELAQIMIDNGAYFAINLDGGGSSTMVMKGADGRPEILNSPVNNLVPGLERPVANHLGIIINK